MRKVGGRSLIEPKPVGGKPTTGFGPFGSSQEPVSIYETGSGEKVPITAQAPAASRATRYRHPQRRWAASPGPAPEFCTQSGTDAGLYHAGVACRGGGLGPRGADGHRRHPRPDRPGNERQTAAPSARGPSKQRQSAADPTGGIRVRIATGPAPIGNRPGSSARHGTAPPHRRPPRRSRRRPRWNSNTYRRATAGSAQNRDNLDAWAKGFAFNERLCYALEHAYQHSLERIALAEALAVPRRRG